VSTLDRLLASPRRPRATAVIDGEVTIDSAGLDAAASAAAGGLRSLGVRRGDVVAWQLPNWWEAIVLFHACWRSGAVAAPIHHQVGASEVAHMVEDLDPTVTLSARGLPLGGLVDAIGVRNGDPRFDALLAGRPTLVLPRGSDVAVVLFTSGSTGYPKAVLHSHRGLAYKASNMVAAHGLTQTTWPSCPRRWPTCPDCSTRCSCPAERPWRWC